MALPHKRHYLSIYEADSVSSSKSGFLVFFKGLLIDGRLTWYLGAYV